MLWMCDVSTRKHLSKKKKNDFVEFVGETTFISHLAVVLKVFTAQCSCLGFFFLYFVLESEEY